jgi:phage baseplate assembly protein W|tara:strand:+ start:469 stop:873 length:405 start_codon:yes stop_codon:yes gene_type:complete
MVYSKSKTVAISEYSDIDLFFKPHPITGDVSLKHDDAAVKRSVRNIVQTNFNERPFKPGLGSGVREMLFELSSDRKVRRLAKFIKETIETFEPRVENVFVSLTTKNNYLNVGVNYSIIHGETDNNVRVKITRTR